MTINSYYVDVPITLLYKTPIRSDAPIQVFVQGGGYFACGLFGESKLYDLSGNTIKSNTFKEDVFDMRRFDVGLSIGAGLQIAQVQIGLRYDFGLVKTNLLKEPIMFDEQTGIQLGDTRNKNFQVSLTYMFKGKRNK